jgi:choline dehydrogenase-like flavoprotein
MLLTNGLFNSNYYHYFVIGTGPAGMSVALELAKANKSVLMFESGETTAARVDLPSALNYGQFPPTWWNRHSLRALGGTSNVWSGWLAPLSNRDFDNPATGVKWPLTLAELLPFYRKAAPILDRDAAFIDFEQNLFPGFVYKPFSVREDTPTNFAVKYRRDMETSPLIHVLLGCSVLGFDATDSRSAVKSITYRHHASESQTTVTIKPTQTLIVACGGFGTPQLLLQPRQDGSVPVGNESGQVGKFLMDHPTFSDAGECVLTTDLDSIARPATFKDHIHALVPDVTTMERYGLRGCAVDFQHATTDHMMARYLSSELGKPCYHYRCTIRTEMLPSEGNRVYLTGERSPEGFYTPAVRFVIDGDDFLNADTTLRILGRSLIDQGRGRLRVINSRIYRDFTGGGHLMGTTRMGTNPSTSVVDRDCRVHGYRNLFIASSSVFPTTGYANPTLTIVALALRLADMLVKAA